MAFDSLTEKLQNVFKNLRSKGRLTEEDVKAALKEVKMALLEADVNFKVVKNFVKTVQERAVGQDVLNSLTPGQMVVKLVNEELVTLMGSDTTEIALKPSSEISVILMCGLQGAGKTTTTAKIAGKLKKKGRRPLLAACDIYRPAAIEQLQKNGEKQGVEVFTMGTNHKPVDIAKAAIEHASKNNLNVVILDTAGRLHIDEDMMAELQEIKENVEIDDTILVVDAMTGQDAVNVATTFNEKIGVDGVILTKLDGDTRGGAALSIRAVTGKPILYVGMGEKLSDLEQFYPDRMASRILGMGDVLTLIEKAEAEIDQDKAKEMERKFRKAEFDFNDFLDQMAQMKKMGGIQSILSMLPGMGLPTDLEIDDNIFKGIEAIIYSMTPEERGNPAIINPSRKRRIAKGAGVNMGAVSGQLGYGGASRTAEDVMVARDCILALHTGASVCIQHISSGNSVELVRLAKKLGADVHAEATPHHFTLTEGAVLTYGTMARMNPPVREEADRLKIIEGIQDGTIDMIVTDHAPHSAEEKARPMAQAPSGITGLETSLALGIRSLVQPGYITLMKLMELMSKNPMEFYRMTPGSIQAGVPADIVIFGENEEWTVEHFHSKASNSPFFGWTLPGKLHYTICNGKIVAEN